MDYGLAFVAAFFALLMVGMYTGSHLLATMLGWAIAIIVIGAFLSGLFGRGK